MSSDFSVEITDCDKPNSKVVNFKGEFDESVLEDLKAQLDPVLNDTNVSSLVFNMKELEFINSKGIGFLVSVHTHLAKDQRHLVMCDANEAVMDVVSLVGLTSIIPYYENCQEAISSL